jgi:ligand-binding SRPBCC domain-containing protein
MRTYRLQTELWLPRPRAAVFGFFADANNLERITPPWLRFEIRAAGPIEMAEGALIDYRLRLHGVPIGWRTEITCWEPPSRFVDEQRRGPYRLWVHEHMFTEVDGGTLVADNVDYAVPFGALMQKLLVAPDLDRIFRYRKERLAEIFSDERRAGAETKGPCDHRTTGPPDNRTTGPGRAKGTAHGA